MSAEQIESAKKTLIGIFSDIKDIEVITAVAEKVNLQAGPITKMSDLKNVQLEEVSYYSRTTIQAEGDTFMLLPSGPDAATVTEVTKIHQESTNNAVKTWNNMARVTFTGLAIAAELANPGNGLSKEVLDLISKFGIIYNSN